MENEIAPQPKPAFEIPPLLKPWVSKFLQAMLVAALVWFVTWLSTKGIDVQLPPIQAEVKALREEVHTLRTASVQAAPQQPLVLVINTSPGGSGYVPVTTAAAK